MTLLVTTLFTFVTAVVSEFEITFVTPLETTAGTKRGARGTNREERSRISGFIRRGSTGSIRGSRGPSGNSRRSLLDTGLGGGNRVGTARFLRSLLFLCSACGS